MTPAVAAFMAGKVTPIATLDSWTNVTNFIGTPGSKTVSAGDSRLLVVRTSLRTTSDSTITGVSWGGQAMTLVDRETTTTNPDLDTAVWELDEAGIAAASGTSFTLTDSGSLLNTQFRLQAGSYENVDQTDPIVDSFSVNATGGANPTTTALTTVDGGKVLAFVGANRGTNDGGATEDASYSNMTEQLEQTGTTSYTSLAEADADGSNFTPGTTVTHESIAHVVGVSLRAT